MSLAAPTPSRDRLAYFRELRARLDPTGDPADAVADRYVDVPGSISSRLAAELLLAPQSTHLVIGGIGSGKTTQLLAAQQRISQIDDVRALYIDVSEQHDIAKMVPLDIVVQVGKALASVLGPLEAQPFIRELARIDSYSWGREEATLRVLEELLGILPGEAQRLAVLLDGLDRMTDLQVFEQLVVHDLKALRSVGIGIVLVGPLRVMYGLDRTVTERFDSFHYQPWIDVRQAANGRTFFADVLRKRVPPHALADAAIDELVLASGGVLRDLLSLAQSACVEAYINGAEQVGAGEAAIAIDTFGRKHLQGLRPTELEILHRVRTHGIFVQTSEADLALLMTRRVLEYRDQNRLRYAVHLTIERLLEELASS